MKRIGILGGMGPLATIDLYAKIVELTNAAKDQDNIPIVIDNYPQIPDRTAYILHGGEDPFPFIKESATRLKNAGCEAICIACNTAHFFAKRLTDECGVNILHIAKIATASIKSNFPHAKKIAVIATTGTTATPFPAKSWGRASKTARKSCARWMRAHTPAPSRPTCCTRCWSNRW